MHVVCFYSNLGHSNVFICFASFENPKTYQPARERNKRKLVILIVHEQLAGLSTSSNFE
jgi:hypothetical protein